MSFPLGTMRSIRVYINDIYILVLYHITNATQTFKYYFSFLFK